MILMDIFEPSDIETLIRQSCEVTRTQLNNRGLADYAFTSIDSHIIQFERKQILELLGDMDGCEEQLARYYDAAQETYLIVEGCYKPTPYGVVQFTEIPGKRIMVVKNGIGNKEHPQPGLYSKYMAWRWQLDKSGITVIETPDLKGTARLLTTCYANSQKDEHTTLRRYIKNKIHIKVKDPQILTLMGIKGVELGETRATALIARFGTVWCVLGQSVDSLCEVDGIGPKTARDLLQAVGRTII